MYPHRVLAPRASLYLSETHCVKRSLREPGELWALEISLGAGKGVSLVARHSNPKVGCCCFTYPPTLDWMGSVELPVALGLQ